MIIEASPVKGLAFMSHVLLFLAQAVLPGPLAGRADPLQHTGMLTGVQLAHVSPFGISLAWVAV